MAEAIESIKLKVKKYLELENVSFLFGAGSSFHLGAPVIRTIPQPLKDQCLDETAHYFGKGADPSYEDLFNCLQADRYLKEMKKEDVSSLNSSMVKMQKWLFEQCDTNKTSIHSIYSSDSKLQKNRYHYHEVLVKKLLQRPVHLKRANLFTTNYDMAFDYALDNLGVHYINGFMGVHNRCFRPEVYDYDLYYPGQSAIGKVHRAEKVLRYYKMHGSLSWVSTTPNVSNTYGIKEIPLNDNFPIDENNEIMIYPCVSKKSFTLDLPYSELFRQFSQSINQPQSVLICVGYSFYDEHINDIIKQALSIPSFTLIIANFAPKADPESEIEKLQALGDRRIIILDQTIADQSTFVGFVDKIMPDLYEEDEITYVAETMEKIYPAKKNDQDVIGNDTISQDEKVESDSNTKQDVEATDDLPF
ncbi:SIR2 family protein [Epilithonimonas sp.]|uniref:SIR2 family protein n=1 Tax=Epilithonimonas sp. TaxID=2894511 RepID=UPI00289A2D07|nr:SIR2 family protein [Epilithonimonas sp.]